MIVLGRKLIEEEIFELREENLKLEISQVQEPGQGYKHPQ